ncbi:hypothetical protein [Deinococcus cellulosilyticus]|uniref:hypothetical protein n=1 Tax=Deinococcus cellulosilyticus TaxID=401558 RepID=UPI0011BD4B40|nr:hypothetical protein [Deinococcus cellulosilyticus]
MHKLAFFLLPVALLSSCGTTDSTPRATLRITPEQRTFQAGVPVQFQGTFSSLINVKDPVLTWDPVRVNLWLPNPFYFSEQGLFMGLETGTYDLRPNVSATATAGASPGKATGPLLTFSNLQPQDQRPFLKVTIAENPALLQTKGKWNGKVTVTCDGQPTEFEIGLTINTVAGTTFTGEMTMLQPGGGWKVDIPASRIYQASDLDVFDPLKVAQASFYGFAFAYNPTKNTAQGVIPDISGCSDQLLQVSLSRPQ